MKFLVVDDSKTMRRIMCAALNTLGHKEHVQAEDGNEALSQLNNETIDFVITDWNMPNMNGLELTKTIRDHPDFNGLPILMVTTRGMKEDVLAAMQARVNNYIVKPFTPDLLREKINSILRLA